MRFILVSILAAVLVHAPAMAAWSQGCLCVASPHANDAYGNQGDFFTGDASTPVSGGCCSAAASPESGPTGDDRANNSNPEPCDGCDCPMACCTASKSFVYVIAAPGYTAAAYPVVLPAPDDTLRGSPHLLRLKRPPRPIALR